MPVAPVSLFRSLTLNRREAGDAPSSLQIAVPDGYSAALLMGYVAPWFPAEVRSGARWHVTVMAAAESVGEEWVFEVLSLVERWLDAVPLPCARVRYCGQSYLIRAASRAARAERGGAPRLTPGPAA